MIHLSHIWKGFPTVDGEVKWVARDIDMVFPTGVSVALMGRNGAGKSTLMNMIGGTMKPDAGQINVVGTVSFPVGFAGSFHRDMTGAQNTRFVARIYGVDTDELLDFVQDFSELGSHFHVPVRNYSAGMRSRLAFGISMGIPFDTYLVDEATAVGDAAFRLKSRAVFDERMRQSGAIVVNHSLPELRQMCEAGAVLDDGELVYYERLDDAISHYQSLIGTKSEV